MLIICADDPTPDAFPSSAAFDLISQALSDPSEQKAAIKQGNAIFAFTLKNKAGKQESWHIDLKNKGVVGKGVAPQGGKATGSLPLCPDVPLANMHQVTLSLSDDDFAQLVAGKANAQKLFMSGKIKIKGDMMKATKLDPILKKAQSKAPAAKL